MCKLYVHSFAHQIFCHTVPCVIFLSRHFSILARYMPISCMLFFLTATWRISSFSSVYASVTFNHCKKNQQLMYILSMVWPVSCENVFISFTTLHKSNSCWRHSMSPATPEIIVIEYSHAYALQTDDLTENGRGFT